MTLSRYMRGDPVNYLLVLRNEDIPSELLNLGSSHTPSEVRAWVCLPEAGRWVEVECLCGEISRQGGSETYLELATSAWVALCAPTEPASA